MSELEKYYSVREVMEILGRSNATIRAYIKAGLLPARKLKPDAKNSKFVIAELSHHNNGAYYEAGYALGLGKEVIHICSESELKSGLHFDVAQVNTITYKDVNEIPEKLKKRIHATIENK